MPSGVSVGSVGRDRKPDTTTARETRSACVASTQVILLGEGVVSLPYIGNTATPTQLVPYPFLLKQTLSASKHTAIILIQ